MKKTTRLFLQLILVFLAVATYIVFRFPQQTQQIMRPLFSSKARLLVSTERTLSKNKNFYFLQEYISLLTDQNYSVTNQLTALPTFALGTGNDYGTATISLSGVSLVNTEIDREESNWSASMHTDSFTYGASIVSVRDQKTTYFRLDKQNITATEGNLPPLLLLWKGILEQYKGARIGNEGSMFSLHQRFANNTTNIRLLEIEEGKTFIGIDGDTFVFSGTFSETTNTLIGSLSNPHTGLTGSVKSTKKGMYELVVNQGGYTFIGELKTGNINGLTMTISGIVSTPKEITFPVTWKNSIRKTSKGVLPTPPVEYIAWATIIRNLKTLGLSF